MPETHSLEESAEAPRAQLFSTLPTDQGAYQPDMAFAAEDGTLSAIRLQGIHYGREDALAHKTDCEKSKDSFVAFAHMDAAASLSRDAAMKKMEEVMDIVRETTYVQKEDGHATFTGAIAGRDGITWVSAGDSHVFIVSGDNERVAKLNKPHQALYINKEGKKQAAIVAAVGKKDRDFVKDADSGDRYGFISYDKIRERFGEGARVVVASDGILAQFDNMSTQTDAGKFQDDMHAKDEEAMGRLVRSVGSADAAALAGKALATGSQDDITVVSFAAAPGHAAFVSDGVGRSVHSAEASQIAIRAAAEEMANGMGSPPIEAKPLGPEATAALLQHNRQPWGGRVLVSQASASLHQSPF